MTYIIRLIFNRAYIGRFIWIQKHFSLTNHNLQFFQAFEISIATCVFF